jgi:hypothetical protein
LKGALNLHGIGYSKKEFFTEKLYVTRFGHPKKFTEKTQRDFAEKLPKIFHRKTRSSFTDLVQF